MRRGSWFFTVKLRPPFNLTMKIGDDANLWCYWNQTNSCEENEVRYRTNSREWQVRRRRGAFRWSLLTWVLLRRAPSSAPGASASTCPPPAPSTSCRSAAEWRAAVESPCSGATGASLCCGDPTTAQPRQVKGLLDTVETRREPK